MKTAVVVLASLSPAVAGAQTLTSGPDEPNQYVLPDPLVTANGGRVTTKEAWPARRAEILDLFLGTVYGRVPSMPTRVTWAVTKADAAAMAGAATLKMITIHVEKGTAQLDFPVVMFAPNARKGRVPVFLLINNRGADNTDPTRATKSDFWPAEEIIRRGYAIAAFQVNDLAADREDGYKSGIQPILDPPGPRAPDAWGKLAAWAWGASRVIDYFQTDKDVDTTRIAVVGHSRGGKTALLAGAQDARVALAVSNDSGCSGAKISRRLTGESVARITQVFPYWFAPRYRDFAGKEDQLPIDQHELIGLLAPRAVYVASAEQDANADPRGEYLGLHHAGEVYALWGHQAVPRAMPAIGKPVYSGPMGYHIRTGGHGLTLFDWQRFCDFADRIWPVQAAPAPDASATAAGADASGPDVARDTAPPPPKPDATSADTTPASPAPMTGPGGSADAASGAVGIPQPQQRRGASSCAVAQGRHASALPLLAFALLTVCSRCAWCRSRCRRSTR